ncbi:MAG: flagellar filament capping protein FliD [Treponema sp.]|nr:flagellar filament capping protein FliD [Spirochaetia bacterium]MDD7581034.1 flagellar filament capping protein FliD [Treponema sp.]MDY5837153.1 flagellar filament capping protein FliD [Treponema sp.]
MADGLNIPGVSDKYKTNDLVKSLMEVERIPLKREEANLETYNKQQSAWRDINQKMSSLRESVKSLYSFENPFSNKLASSSDEFAVSVDAGREADFGSFKIDVLQPAQADRFLSDEIGSDYNVPQGKYTFKVGEKTIEYNWKGGKLTDFVDSVNKRGNNTIKASLIGVSPDKKSLLLESLKTGEENALVLENKAFDLALKIGMISETKPETTNFTINQESMKITKTKDAIEQEGLEPISKSRVSTTSRQITIGARGGFETDLPESITSKKNQKIEFTFTEEKIKDITEGTGSVKEVFQVPSAGGIEYEGITVYNNLSETTLPPGEEKKLEGLKSIETSNENIFFIKDIDGNETALTHQYFSSDGKTKSTKVSFKLDDFPNAKTLVVRNSNTGKEITMTMPVATDTRTSLGYKPNHAASQACDAKIRYEGITLSRPSNDIDDVVPHITLHVHEKTEKTATVKIEPDTESAKDAIITFVGKYNQTIAEINILTTNKPEVISELDYLSKDEQEEAKEKLGMFQSENSLRTGKTNLMQIVSGNYKFLDSAQITMLSQIGVSTNASGGTRGGYNPSQMRGYLEVDEKKLDQSLASNLNDIKNIFGYDSDGDLIIDDGIGLKLDKQLSAWVQSGGIINTKNQAIDSKIKATNTKITKLQTQLDRKEAELKMKYANMQGTLGGLESQQNSIQNFANQSNRSR